MSEPVKQSLPSQNTSAASPEHEETKAHAARAVGGPERGRSQNQQDQQDQQDQNDISPSKLDAALALAAEGFAVFPLHEPVFTDGEPVRCSCGEVHDKLKDIGKHPRVGAWQHKATDDAEQVRTWWTRWPHANIGLATGAASGVIVLDEDAPGAADAVRQLVGGDGLPTTRRVRTGRGTHTYYRGAGIRNSASKVATALDVRGDGGYVVAPGSTHALGTAYEWEDATVPIADLPAGLATALRDGDEVNATQAHDASLGDATTEPDPASMGEGSGRNDYLTRLAGRLRRAGLDRSEIEDQLLEVNARFAVPLADDEVRVVAKSVARYAVADHLTDLGNAQRLVARHGENLHYVAKSKRWVIWDGTRWKEDELGKIERLAKETVVAFGKDAFTRTDLSKDDQKRAVAWAFASESGPRLREMERVARSEPDVPITVEALDTDPWLLNVRNGTLDLRTGELRPHARADLITKCAPVVYDPSARAPKWERFVSETQRGDAEMVAFLQRYVGYGLTGIATAQVFAIFWGEGNNGKSQFVEAIRGVLGADFVAATSFDALIARQGPSIRNDIAALRGSRLVTAAEGEHGAKLGESVIKLLTGDDTFKVRFLYQEEFDLKPTFKLILITQHKPIIRGTDTGIWRRPLLVPWLWTVPPERRVEGFAKLLVREEAAGILNWALAGCLAWQHDGLAVPEFVRMATAEYRAESDLVAEFIESQCNVGPELMEQADRLCRAFKDWVPRSRGDELSDREFLKRIAELGHRVERAQRNHLRTTWCDGLRLRQQELI